MGVIDVLKSARFVVDGKGHRTGVLLSVDAWESLLAWIEDTEDSEIVRKALTELQAAGGRPGKAGWLGWDDIKAEWGDDNVQSDGFPESSRLRESVNPGISDGDTRSSRGTCPAPLPPRRPRLTG